MKTKLRPKSTRKKIGAKFEIRITRLGEELFSMLLGMELFFSQSAQQYVKNLGLKNEREVVEAMLSAGYLVGTIDDWKINPSIKDDIFKSLERDKVLVSFPSLKKEPPVPLHELIYWFKFYCKQIKDASLRPNLPKDMFLRFRRLCKKYDSREIVKQITNFFRLAKYNHDYEFESFEKYVHESAQNKFTSFRVNILK